MEKPWFIDWFNSKYYHLLYKHRDETEAELFIDHMIAKLPLHGNRIWDLCCGKGRHSIQLNKKGFDVIGTDLSEENIKTASLSANETLNFAKLDMRSIYLSNYFDLVVNLFTSFGYFDFKRDDQKVFNSIQNALKPGGLFLLDYLNTEKAIKHITVSQVIEVEKIKFNIEKTVDNNFITKNISFTDNGEKFHFQEKIKHITKDDFSDYASSAGLKLINTYGDYTFSDFDVKESNRLILIFQK